MPRRSLLASAVAILALPAYRQSAAASLTDVTGFQKFTDYENKQQGYHIQRPEAWSQIGKAGADVLFEDVQRKSSKLGVTVSPIRVDSLEAFGDLDNVAARLLAAEKAKESTTGVELLRQATRKGQSGVTIYDFEYELDSTRGRKRILNTVAISRRQLYIVNGAAKCDRNICDGAAEAAMQLMRLSADSFDLL